MTEHPTSMRLRPETRELLDAWGELLTERRGSKASRMDVISLALKHMKPPEGQDPSEAAVRRAYHGLFG